MSSKTRLDERSSAWAKNLAAALKLWLRTNGYESGAKLADELKIRRTVWSHIQAGNAISPPEIYAAIFLRTQLAAADPCSLPPRLAATPEHASVRKERAWTLAQWQTWLKRKGPKPAAPAPPTANVSAPGSEITLTAFFTELRALRTAVADLTALLQPGRTTPDEIETLALRLKAHLDRAIAGTVSERDHFQSRYGETVKLLLNLADALTISDRAKREAAVARTREYGEVKL